MEKYNSPQQWHKNLLKKEEEIFLMVLLFFIGGFFLYRSMLLDQDNSSQIKSLSTSYSQFSIVEHAYASQNR